MPRYDLKPPRHEAVSHRGLGFLLLAIVVVPALLMLGIGDLLLGLAVGPSSDSNAVPTLPAHLSPTVVEQPTETEAAAARESDARTAQAPDAFQHQQVPQPEAGQEQGHQAFGREAADAAAVSDEAASSDRQVYVVQPGDQLKHIAARFDIGLWDLARANGIENPDLLRAGQELMVPVLQAQDGGE